MRYFLLQAGLVQSTHSAVSSLFEGIGLLSTFRVFLLQQEKRDLKLFSGLLHSSSESHQFHFGWKSFVSIAHELGYRRKDGFSWSAFESSDRLYNPCYCLCENARCKINAWNGEGVEVRFLVIFQKLQCDLFQMNTPRACSRVSERISLLDSMAEVWTLRTFSLLSLQRFFTTRFFYSWEVSHMLTSSNLTLSSCVWRLNCRSMALLRFWYSLSSSLMLCCMVCLIICLRCWMACSPSISLLWKRSRTWERMRAALSGGSSHSHLKPLLPFNSLSNSSSFRSALAKHSDRYFS